MTGIVVTGGNAPEFKFIKKFISNADFIVAADSGLDTLHSYGIEPDIVIGDMDSIKNPSLLQKMDPGKIIRFHKDKDYTDTELALDYLDRAGYQKKIIIGGGGGRLDHQIALYSLFSRNKSPDMWITPNEKILLVENDFSISIKKNTIVSLFPICSEICRMKSSGLKWELNGLEWTIGDSGISNIALNDTILINMISGRLIMIIPLSKH